MAVKVTFAALLLLPLLACQPAAADQPGITSNILGVNVPGATSRDIPNKAEMVEAGTAAVRERGQECRSFETFALQSGKDTFDDLVPALEKEGYRYEELARYTTGRVFRFVGGAGQRSVTGLVNNELVFWCAG